MKRILAVLVVFAFVVLGTMSTASGSHGQRGAEISELASFGILGSGSTIGPDGALYVTDGDMGRVLRIDPRTGAISTFAQGLPPEIAGIGGAMDVAFIGRTAYVLVTLVGPSVGGNPADTVGIYRINSNGSFTVIADIGAWSLANPPDTDFFVPTGVQYAIQAYWGGFLVTDGHHNRVLRVTLGGHVSEVVAFGNVVPTGLEVIATKVYMGQAGPVPHLPENGKVVSFHTWWPTARQVAQGASMIVDVEFGPWFKLYALSQGEWDGVAEGSPALMNTGRLVQVKKNGSFAPVVDKSGAEIMLDRPTSLEFIGDTAYVVSLTGNVYKIKNVS